MQNTVNTNEVNENTLPKILYRVLVGILFGFANVIPGVSGGTVMVVLGVYERIIRIITEFFKRIKSEWKFFFPIGVGMVIAIVLFGKVMSRLLSSHEAVTQMFFIGVIIFSIPGILKKAVKTDNRKLKTDISCAVAFILMLALMVFMSYSPANDEKAAIKGEKAEITETVDETAEETEEPEEEEALSHSAGTLALLVVYGAIACATMIIPGISGSLVMVMLGQYKNIMLAIDRMDILYLAPFAVGCLIGLIVCAKVIKWLLKNHERVTYAAILGFVIGSLLPVFPGWGAAVSVAGIIAFLVGGACIVGCDLLSARVNG